MTRIAGLILAFGLLIGSVVPVSAKASISAPDGLHYLDTFVPTWTEPKHPGIEFVYLRCYQAGTLVFAENVGLGTVSGTNVFPLTLGPSQLWTGGGASCVVSLETLTRVLALDSFEVLP